MKIENRLYPSAEAAKLLGVSIRTLYNYIKGEQIQAIHRGGKIYIDGDELQAFMGRDLKKGYYIGLYGKKDKKESEG